MRADKNPKPEEQVTTQTVERMAATVLVARAWLAAGSVHFHPLFNGFSHASDDPIPAAADPGNSCAAVFGGTGRLGICCERIQ